MIKPFVQKLNQNQTLAHANVDYSNLKELQKIVEKRNFDTSPLEQIKNNNRKFEWLSIRLLLDEVVNNCPDIHYNMYGKPFLQKCPIHISISHSFHKIAVLTNNSKSTGVDLQHLNNKIFRIREKFLRKEELLRKKDISLEELTTYWSAKEALFKVYGKGDIFLGEHIQINEFDFNPKGGKLSGKLLLEEFPNDFNLRYELIEDYILAYVVNP